MNLKLETKMKQICKIMSPWQDELLIPKSNPLKLNQSNSVPVLLRSKVETPKLKRKHSVKRLESRIF